MNELSRVWDSPGELPGNYEAAKVALSECVAIDQCKDWSDRAAALASYARQADDQTIYNYAMRIKARAVRRAGELLKEIDGRGGDRTKTTAADSSVATQRQVAADAGMSERQQVTAVRVANVPQPQFDLQVESDTPPTVTALAEQGKRPAPIVVIETPAIPKLPGFADAGHFIGEIDDLVAFMGEHPPDLVRAGMYPSEATATLPKVKQVADWLGKYLDLEEDDHVL